MTNFIKTFCKDEKGATAIEYGLIAGLVAVGIIFALTSLSTELSALFDRVSEKLKGATGTKP